MRGEIIAIGDELTRGRVLNSTSRLAARRLFALGHTVTRMLSVGDDPALIGECLLAALERADFLLVTGGLGGTDDDLTTAAAARALGLNTAAHPRLARLRERLAARTDAGDEAKRAALSRYALVPEGAELLDEDDRMAGYLLEHDGKPVWFLPGVPSQMAILLENKVAPELERRFPASAPLQRLYRTCGLPEMEINARLKPLEGRRDLRIGYYPAGFEVDVSLIVPGAETEAGGAVFAEADLLIRDRLGEHIFGEGEASLAQVVGRLLRKAGRRLTLAESCTGGMIAAELTAIPGSSEWFEGGAVVYSNRLKASVLGVAPAIIAEHGAVSEACAKAMAEGALSRLGGDYALAVTGIAGPGGGTPEKPVGTVFLALAEGNGAETRLQTLSLHGDRREIQTRTMQRALDMLRRRLLEA